jgi:hypothetical protein
VSWRGAVDHAERLALELDVLGNRFDHTVDVAARGGEVVARRDPRERRIAIFGGELAELDAFREVLADPVDTGARGPVECIVETHGCAELCSDLRDAVPHRAGADNCNRS